MRKLITLILVLASISIFSQNGFYKGWGFRGDVLGVGTLSLGSTDNFSFAVITNGKTRLIFGNDVANTPSVSIVGSYSASSNGTVAGMLRVGTGTWNNLPFEVLGSTNGLFDAEVRNESSGTAAQAEFRVRGNSTQQFRFGTLSTGFTTSGLFIAGTSYNVSAGVTARVLYGHISTATDILFINGGSAAANEVFRINSSNVIDANVRFLENQGADVASVAGAITLGTDGNTFELTGTNAVTLISNVNWQNGAEVTLIFTSTASLIDGVANSGTDIGFELAGNVNFSGSADDSITLTLCEIGGTQRWREKCRSVN